MRLFDRILLLDGQPGIGLELLHAQRNAPFLAIELQHLDRDLIARMHHFGGMADARVRHVGHVQQAVDAAQVDERAVVGEILHHAGHHGALLQILQGDRAALLAPAPSPPPCATPPRCRAGG